MRAYSSLHTFCIQFHCLHYILLIFNDCTWTSMNTWIELHAHMVSSLCNFGRKWLACKKRYKVLLIEYKNNNHTNNFRYNRLECQYYEQMDLRMHEGVINLNFPYYAYIRIQIITHRYVHVWRTSKPCTTICICMVLSLDFKA